MAITERRMTLQEFLDLPEEEVALEFEDGMVTQKVPPMGKHSSLQVEFTELVNRFTRPKRLARAFTELRTTFGGLSRVPDVSVYLWERIPLDDAGRIENHFTEPPDIVAEIVSPGQGVNQLVARCLWYVEHGVQIALLLDPSHESVLLFRPDHTTTALFKGDTIDLTEVLPGFTVTVQQIFDSLTLPGRTMPD